MVGDSDHEGYFIHLYESKAFFDIAKLFHRQFFPPFKTKTSAELSPALFLVRGEEMHVFPIGAMWMVYSYLYGRLILIGSMYGKSLVFQNPPNTLFLKIFWAPKPTFSGGVSLGVQTPIYIYTHLRYLGVSKNRGTPKRMVYNGNPY